jgi:hypothetical protein
MTTRFDGSRRHFIRTSSLALGFGFVATAGAQLTSFVLALHRDRNLPTTLGLNDCITGSLYHGGGSLLDPGTFICHTLELPYRNELKEISCVKPGAYDGFVKTEVTADGVDLGWRIQLQGTKQTAIQIHTGNTTEQTRGCILVGTRDSSPCQLKGGSSKIARDKIRALYGENNSRVIRVIVLN